MCIDCTELPEWVAGDVVEFERDGRTVWTGVLSDPEE